MVATTNRQGRRHIPLTELDQFKQHRTTPHTSQTVPNTMPARSGEFRCLPCINAWVDGKPTPTTGLGTLPLQAGQHVVVLAINRQTLDQPFKVKADGDAIITNDRRTGFIMQLAGFNNPA